MSGARAALARQNFHYTRSPAICQAKFAKILHKNKLPKLCMLLCPLLADVSTGRTLHCGEALQQERIVLK